MLRIIISMVKSLEKIEGADSLSSLETLDSGNNYHRSVPPELEKDLHKNLNEYLDRFGEI